MTVPKRCKTLAVDEAKHFQMDKWVDEWVKCAAVKVP